jgi:hypothetical protein
VSCVNILLSNEDIELEHVQNILAAEEYLAEELPLLIILTINFLMAMELTISVT